MDHVQDQKLVMTTVMIEINGQPTGDAMNYYILPLVDSIHLPNMKPDSILGESLNLTSNELINQELASTKQFSCLVD